MKVKTITDPTVALDAYEKVRYASNVYFYYDAAKNGKREVKAIAHVVKDGYVIDAEPSVIAKIPGASATTEKPSPLYDITVSAYGKIARHIGVRVEGNSYFGHKILSSVPSQTTWEEIRKQEYQIEKQVEEIEEEIDLIRVKDKTIV